MKTRRIVAALVALFMIVAMMPTAVLGYEADSVSTLEKSNADNQFSITKKATPVSGEPGTYDITVTVTPKGQPSVISSDVEVVFLLDTSGSMAWCTDSSHDHSHSSGGWPCNNVNKDRSNQRLKVAKEAIKDMIGGLYNQFQDNSSETNHKLKVAVVTYDSAAATPVDLTDVTSKTINKIYNAINKIPYGGGTYMVPGLEKAKEAFSHNTNTAKYLIMIGDGDYDDYYYDFENWRKVPDEDGIKNAASNIKDIPATLYTIGFTSDIPIFGTIASTKNGNPLYSTTGTDKTLDNILSDITKQIKADILTLTDSIGANNVLDTNADITFTNGSYQKSTDSKTIVCTITDSTKPATLSYRIKVDVTQLQPGSNSVPLNGTTTLSYRLSDSQDLSSLYVEPPYDTIDVTALKIDYYIDGSIVKNHYSTQRFFTGAGDTFMLDEPIDPSITESDKTYDKDSVEYSTDGGTTWNTVSDNSVPAISGTTTVKVNYKLHEDIEVIYSVIGDLYIDGMPQMDSDDKQIESNSLTGKYGDPIVYDAMSAWALSKAQEIDTNSGIDTSKYQYSVEITNLDDSSAPEKFGSDKNPYHVKVNVVRTPINDVYKVIGKLYVNKNLLVDAKNNLYTYGISGQKGTPIDYTSMQEWARNKAIELDGDSTYLYDYSTAVVYKDGGTWEPEKNFGDLGEKTVYVMVDVTRTHKPYTVTGKLYIDNELQYKPGTNDNYTYDVSGAFGEDIDYSTMKSAAIDQAKKIDDKKQNFYTYSATVYKDGDSFADPESTFGEMGLLHNYVRIEVTRTPVECIVTGKLYIDGNPVFKADGTSMYTWSTHGLYGTDINYDDMKNNALAQAKNIDGDLSSTYVYSVNVYKDGDNFLPPEKTFGELGKIHNYVRIEVTRAATYKVTFNLNGGKVGDSTENIVREGYNAGDTVSAKLEETFVNPTKESHIFIGWLCSDGNTLDLATVKSIIVTGDMIFTAQYQYKEDEPAPATPIYIDSITLASYDAEKKDDGKPLTDDRFSTIVVNLKYDNNTNDNATLTSISPDADSRTVTLTFAEGFQIKTKFTGKQVGVGSSDNTFEIIDITGNLTRPNNPVLTFGKLTITNTDEPDFPLLNSWLKIENNVIAPAGFEKDSYTYEVYNAKNDKLLKTVTVKANSYKSIPLVGSADVYVVPVDAEVTGYTLTTVSDPSDASLSIKVPDTGVVSFTHIYTVGLNTIDHYAYIFGYEDGTVRPEGDITRAEVATIFFRLLSSDAREAFLTRENSFSDVAPDAWYNTAVSTLANVGIITGYPDGTYDPNGSMTRAELVSLIARFFTEIEPGDSQFNDIEGHWAAKEINEAFINGIIDGYDDGSFKPDQSISRAETMKIINGILGREIGAGSLSDDMKLWPDNADETAWFYYIVQEATNSHEYEIGDHEEWIAIIPDPVWKDLESAPAED